MGRGSGLNTILYSAYLQQKTKNKFKEKIKKPKKTIKMCTEGEDKQVFMLIMHFKV